MENSGNKQFISFYTAHPPVPAASARHFLGSAPSLRAPAGSHCGSWPLAALLLHRQAGRGPRSPGGGGWRSVPGWPPSLPPQACAPQKAQAPEAEVWGEEKFGQRKFASRRRARRKGETEGTEEMHVCQQGGMCAGGAHEQCLTPARGEVGGGQGASSTPLSSGSSDMPPPVWLPSALLTPRWPHMPSPVPRLQVHSSDAPGIPSGIFSALLRCCRPSRHWVGWVTHP